MIASLPLVDLWKTKSIVLYFAILNIKIRFRSTYLGILWAVLEPLLMFVILYLVFTSLRSRTEDYAIYLITGIMIYQIFVRGTTGGASLSGPKERVSLNLSLSPPMPTLSRADQQNHPRTIVSPERADRWPLRFPA